MCFEIGVALVLNIDATRREGSDGADHGIMFRLRLEVLRDHRAMPLWIIAGGCTLVGRTTPSWIA